MVSHQKNTVQHPLLVLCESRSRFLKLASIGAIQIVPCSQTGHIECPAMEPLSCLWHQHVTVGCST